MVDIKNPQCISCKSKQPNFNYPEENKPLCCGTCKLDNMVNITETRKCINCKLKRPFLN